MRRIFISTSYDDWVAAFENYKKPMYISMDAFMRDFHKESQKILVWNGEELINYESEIDGSLFFVDFSATIDDFNTKDIKIDEINDYLLKHVCDDIPERSTSSSIICKFDDKHVCIGHHTKKDSKRNDDDEWNRYAYVNEVLSDRKCINKAETIIEKLWPKSNQLMSDGLMCLRDFYKARPTDNCPKVLGSMGLETEYNALKDCRSKDYSKKFHALTEKFVSNFKQK